MHSKNLRLVGLLAVVVLAGVVASGEKEEGFVSLFNGKDLNGFQTVIRDDKRNRGTFTVKDGVIHLSGTPDGYMCTEKSYRNYVLRFDWKFLGGPGTSVLAHITGAHRVWPKCVEIQGGKHGLISGLGSKGIFGIDGEALRRAVKRGEWNTTEIISNNGELSSKVNGVPIASGKGELTEGQIGWQSELGTRLDLKNICIKIRP